MPVLVVGSIAFDSVKTPFGSRQKILGGSATYFSLAASFFTEVRVVAVVGKDFSDRYFRLLRSRRIDTSGVERREGKTFRWIGEYGFDMNVAITKDTKLNVFECFQPTIPVHFQKTEHIFLANIDPELQLRVLKQVKKPKLIVCDTMNFWIENKPKALKKTISKSDILLLNDGEARQLTREPNLLKAARMIMRMGPETVIIKRGEYGAMMFHKRSLFTAPAFPLENIKDPTGAGDSFAGGFVGYLSKAPRVHEKTLRQAVIFGSILASFNVQDFSVEAFKKLTWQKVKERYRTFKNLMHFEDL
jgi:sugar/nucleoside kinase (ribokinase family)